MWNTYWGCWSDNFDINSTVSLSASKLESNISMVNISDIQDNSNFNIAAETTGAIHTSNDFLNLPGNNSLTLTTGNSHLINLQKKWKEKMQLPRMVHYNHPPQWKKNQLILLHLRFKPPLENEKSPMYGNRIFFNCHIWQGRFCAWFHEKKTEIVESTKKSTENISAYKDILARIEVKLWKYFCI